MRPIVTHAVWFGLLLSAVLFALLLGVLRMNAEILLTDYPPDVKAKWGPMSDRTRRQRAWVTGLFLVIIVAIVAWSLETMPAYVAGSMTFASTFGYFVVMFGTFNLLDFCVLDCALVYWQPRFAMLPGTEGMSGYSSYWFHFRGFLIGIPATAAAAALTAALAVWLM